MQEDLTAGAKIEGGARGRLTRRLVHGALSVGVVYYLLLDVFPEFNILKWFIIAIILAAMILIERWRFKTGKLLFGMRPYEAKRIGSYFYGVIGMIVVLVISPVEIGAPCLVAMAWADPIAGEMRFIRRTPTQVVLITGISYALIFLLIQQLLSVELIITLILLLPVTAIAIIAEVWKVGWLDDDFSMLVFPALVGILLLTLLEPGVQVL